MGVGPIAQHRDLGATPILSDIYSWETSVIFLNCVVSIDSNMTGIDFSPKPCDERAICR